MYTVGDIATCTGGRVVGSSAGRVRGIADLASAGAEDISFFTHPRYRAQFAQTQAGCVLVQHERAAPHPDCALIVCADPYLALAHVAAVLHRRKTPTPARHPGAHIHPDAVVHPSASVGAGAVIEAGARVGARTEVGALCFLGVGSQVGDDCHLHASVRLMADCTVGDRCILHPGCVVGSDGFGFATDRATGKHHKIPQVGRVIVGDDVEVGANSTIDRATFGATRIGDGTKIDNLVQIGHNVVLGEQCIVVSQSGIAGSTTLGANVIIGAQAGIGGHLTVVGNVMLAARAGVTRSIDAPGIYSGLFNVAPHREALKVSLAQAKLPELLRRVRHLEDRVDAVAPQHDQT
jgi:UDP-3-O-[3-hydroxymyristoyl] glucosamine N-acyltransferase